jgi:hypothetical protein
MPISIQVDQVGNGPAQRAKVYRGAINVTTPSSNSSIRDFISAADLSPMPDDVVALFNDGTETTGDLVYVPPAQAVSARA